MNIKVKINGLLAWLFGASGKSEYEVDISPASKRQGDLMKKMEREGLDTQGMDVWGDEYKLKFQEKLERRKAENKIRNDTARSIRG